NRALLSSHSSSAFPLNRAARGAGGIECGARVGSLGRHAAQKVSKKAGTPQAVFLKGEPRAARPEKTFLLSKSRLNPRRPFCYPMRRQRAERAGMAVGAEGFYARKH